MRFHQFVLGVSCASLIALGAGCRSSQPASVSTSTAPGNTASSTVVVTPALLKPNNPPKELAVVASSSYRYFTNATVDWGETSWVGVFPTSSMKGTNLQRAAISMYGLPGACDKGLEIELADTFKKLAPATISTSNPASPSWQGRQWAGAAGGTTVDSVVYRLAHNGSCYRIVLDLWSMPIASYPKAKRPKAYDPAPYITVLKEVVQSTPLP